MYIGCIIFPSYHLAIGAQFFAVPTFLFLFLSNFTNTKTSKSEIIIRYYTDILVYLTYHLCAENDTNSKVPSVSTENKVRNSGPPNANGSASPRSR